MKYPVLCGPEIPKTELAVDALGIHRSLMRDEMYEMGALQVGAGDLIALHQRQAQLAKVLGIDGLFGLTSTNNLLDRVRILPILLCDVDRHARASSPDERR